jgi:hypothetical protein
MTNTIKIVGEFVFSADAKPKGARLVRRLQFRAPTEYSFRSVTSTEAPVALEVEAHDGNAIRVQSYRAHDGRLWLPARHDASPQTYATLLADWPRHGWHTVEAIEALGEERFDERRRADAILNAHVPGDEPIWPMENCWSENAFAGRIFESNRIEAERAFLKAASDQIFVDGTLHRAFPAPVWVVDHNTDAASICLFAPSPNREFWSGHVPNYGGDLRHRVSLSYGDAFSHERHDDALAWAAIYSRCAGGVETKGRVIADRGGYEPAPILGYAALAKMREILEWSLALTPHLTPEAAAAWGRLNAAYRGVTAHDPGAARDWPTLLADIRILVTPVRQVFLATDLYRSRDALLNAADRLFTRSAFDEARAPSPREIALAL